MDMSIFENGELAASYNNANMQKALQRKPAHVYTTHTHRLILALRMPLNSSVLCSYCQRLESNILHLQRTNMVQAKLPLQREKNTYAVLNLVESSWIWHVDRTTTTDTACSNDGTLVRLWITNNMTSSRPLRTSQWLSLCCTTRTTNFTEAVELTSAPPTRVSLL